MNKLTPKLLVISLLSLALLIPTFTIFHMAKERRERRDQVLDKSAAIWGKPRLLGAPIVRNGWKIIPAERVLIKGALDAQQRNRGIFKIPFYTTELDLTGEMNLTAKPTGAARLMFRLDGARRARVTRGVFAGKPVYFSIGKYEGMDVLQARLPKGIARGKHSFSMKLSFAGIKRLYFLPTAKSLQVELNSNWPDPNFSGGSLPIKRSVDKKGFKAVWSGGLGGGDPAAIMGWRSASPGTTDGPAFGVNLFMPVDLYHKIERSLKYSILFIGLTFLAFFVFEVFQTVRVHPLQYLFVGFALCVFYLLLLSIAEHIGFTWAYLLATAGVTGMITTYSVSVLGTRKRAAGMAGLLLGLYTFLYVILELEAYSLLMGSIGLFIILGVVMYLTRNVNWYERSESIAPNPNKPETSES